jgi:hypothetical protein
MDISMALLLKVGFEIGLITGCLHAVRSVADELAASGHRTIGIRCNVVDEAEVAAMVEQTVSTFGCPWFRCHTVVAAAASFQRRAIDGARAARS